MTKITAFAVFAMVLVAFCVMPVMAANADNDLYTSKYAATPTDFPTTGSLSGAVRCHNNLLTTGVTVTDPNGIVTPVNLRADGTFDLNDLAPGEYVMNIADGNGGQPESAKFTIRAGYTSFLESELLGHAVSPADEPITADVITVVNATYGMTRIVIDSPAVPAVPGVPAIPGHYDCVGHNNGNYDKITHHGQTSYVYVGNHHGDYVYVATVPAIPAIPAIPAVTHIEGTFIDVTSAVQTAIDGGNREFVFNNAMNPGGIVNVDQTAVLVPITDPAPGLVKSVVINVMVNGVLETIDTMEYETITI
jgi:hypothetical protein